MHKLSIPGHFSPPMRRLTSPPMSMLESNRPFDDQTTCFTIVTCRYFHLVIRQDPSCMSGKYSIVKSDRYIELSTQKLLTIAGQLLRLQGILFVCDIQLRMHRDNSPRTLN